jgi:uncharacterized membrane protein YdjX (TVP38/TMEM64 family)
LILLAVIGLGGLAAVIFGGRQLAGYIPAFAEWVDGLGIWGPVVFILGYIVATVAFVPGALLTLAAGVLFGLVKGTLFVVIGSSLGACAAFLVGRYGARRFVEKEVEGNQKFAAIDRAVGKNGLKIVLLLRLSPAFPFNMLNYALGLTKVRFLDYAIACIGMLPGTFLYVYYGYTAGSLAEAVSDSGAERGIEGWIFLGVGLLATVVVTVIVTRIAQRALKESTDVQEVEA